MPRAQVTLKAYCTIRSLKTSYPPKYTAKVACHVIIYCSSIDRYTIMNYKFFGPVLIVPPDGTMFSRSVLQYQSPVNLSHRLLQSTTPTTCYYPHYRYNTPPVTPISSLRPLPLHYTLSPVLPDVIFNYQFVLHPLPASQPLV